MTGRTAPVRRPVLAIVAAVLAAVLPLPAPAQDDGDTGDGGTGVFEPPEDLEPCQTAYGDTPVVRLSWSNPESYEGIEVRVDGEPADSAVRVDGAFGIAEVTADAGNREFTVIGSVGDLESQPASLEFEVIAESPVADPVRDLDCEYVPGAGGHLVLSWTTDPEGAEGPATDPWVRGEVRLGGRRGNVGFSSEVMEVEVPLLGESPAPAVVAFKNAGGYFSEPTEVPCVQRRPAFLRGDCDGNGTVDITDAIFELNHVLRASRRWYCDDACDANDDGQIDISDALATLGHLFRGEAPPPAPGPQECGIDPTEDFLGGICEPVCP